MKFALVVLGAPCAGHTALRFATAALEAGHEIYRVFFYQDGVYCASAFNALVEPNDRADWQKLGRDHKIDLVACVSSGMRRGLITDQDAKNRGLAQGNLAEGFEIAGLGQLIEASLQVDRLITFNA